MRRNRQARLAPDVPLGQVHIALFRPVQDLDIYPLARRGGRVGRYDDEGFGACKVPDAVMLVEWCDASQDAAEGREER
jgi:hypothetical protein